MVREILPQSRQEIAKYYQTAKRLSMEELGEIAEIIRKRVNEGKVKSGLLVTLAEISGENIDGYMRDFGANENFIHLAGEDNQVERAYVLLAACMYAIDQPYQTQRRRA